MHKLPLTLATGVLAASALAVSLVQPASADSAHNAACVTQAEFNKVTRGMTVATVAQIFGTNGRQTMRVPDGPNVFTMREYTPCSPLTYVSVSFNNGHETSKSSQ